VIILCNFLMLDDLLDAISIQYGMGNFLGPLWFVSESSILQGFNEATIFVLFFFFFGYGKYHSSVSRDSLVLWLVFVQILS
jgi:hypothetical protein